MELLKKIAHLVLLKSRESGTLLKSHYYNPSLEQNILNSIFLTSYRSQDGEESFLFF